jgi:mRNA interferase RelE/StbE
MYRIELSRPANKALDAIPVSDRRRVIRAIDDLRVTPRPRGARKLQGGRGQLRIRVGDYRIIYEVDDNIIRIFVVAIGPRRDVYR